MGKTDENVQGDHCEAGAVCFGMWKHMMVNVVQTLNTVISICSREYVT